MTEHNIKAVQAAAEAVLPELTARLGAKHATRELAFDLARVAVDAAGPVIHSQTLQAMQDVVIAEVGTVMAARRDELEAAVRADERRRIADLLRGQP